ncbi:DUF1156 domain-containing protein [Leptospira fletcheri]|uniref:DUF1156 domain-containing protein n=1 Tax=Leptospira fletcheri TaxID=2484981 RepID=A0A4R9G4T9_9LEPT|nr:anti-phage-associated DUF1156 domain-containing protein [Leptospira fletcheri]TGK06542.1 DUF1156 domain-containing protein [Leptospira fletcheri]
MSDLTFIETQFPVSKISKESYKERMANYSQTLTGLGKWWGRKPLILVRATILGLLLPASNQPEKDREIFLKILTMDEEGLWQRKQGAKKNIRVEDIWRILTEEAHEVRVKKFLQYYEVLPQLMHDLRASLSIYITEKNRKFSWVKKTDPQVKAALEKLAFQSLYYDEKLNYTLRPENIPGPDKTTWTEINQYLGTKAKNLQELVEELGARRFGHRPKVGDAFCGGGSIPFEAARIGCDVYASDLNPVATLLTWAAIHIVGGGPEVAKEVRTAQEEIYEAVDRQVTEWKIEHNKEGHRADAYLYCVEVIDPETGWKVPLAPSWVIGEKTKTVAILKPDKKAKRYEIEIKMGATNAEIQAAKKGTVANGYVVHSENPNKIPMSLIRRENKGGLRPWEKGDFIPRADDVFQERLYCIRYVVPGKKRKEDLNPSPQQNLFETEEAYLPIEEETESYRYYTAPSSSDLKREEKVIQLLQEKFAEWQDRGYIPSRKIESGPKTDEPIRTRGWTHWHHLFNPRQLLAQGLFFKASLNSIVKGDLIRTSQLLGINKMADWNSKLSKWDPSFANEKGSPTFVNQALNTFYNYVTRTVKSLTTTWKFEINSYVSRNSNVLTTDSKEKKIFNSDIWITDPPYADAVNYHELSEFFLAWYEKHIPKLFPDWYTDSKRSLAIKGQNEDFRRSMVEAYSNLAKHMPDNGLQVVMFTHQDAGVWADLALILWASGLRVTAAWTIATETTSALKVGNYVQGTVLLILRKNLSNDTAFLDELIPQIEDEVKRQVDSMHKIEDKEEPNFSDTDYQLAAYAAALRILTSYRVLGDIEVDRELARTRSKTDKSPLETVIENARNVASSYLIPDGLDKSIWTDFSGMERYYLKALDLESKGESKAGSYQELARGLGVRDYETVMQSLRANEARPKTPKEFGDKILGGGGGFGISLTRQAVYSIYSALEADSGAQGRVYLQTEVEDFQKQRHRLIRILRYLERFGHTLSHWQKEGEIAGTIAGLLETNQG